MLRFQIRRLSELAGVIMSISYNSFFSMHISAISFHFVTSGTGNKNVNSRDPKFRNKASI